MALSFPVGNRPTEKPSSRKRTRPERRGFADTDPHSIRTNRVRQTIASETRPDSHRADDLVAPRQVRIFQVPREAELSLGKNARAHLRTPDEDGLDENEPPIVGPRAGAILSFRKDLIALLVVLPVERSLHGGDTHHETERPDPPGEHPVDLCG